MLLNFPLFISMLICTVVLPCTWLPADNTWEPGVSLELARSRKQLISAVEYDLTMELKPAGPIQSNISIRFRCVDPQKPVVLDFSAPEKNILAIQVNGKKNAKYTIENGHLLIEPGPLKMGPNEVRIEFIAGDLSLNRNESFMYTLLVPDRASTVFPCFDQPDLKARFRLDLQLPPHWTATSNGPLLKKQTRDDLKTLTFGQTKPISTYLFAFAAGEFRRISRKINGRSMTMLHRESDVEKVNRNVDAIFQLHSLALDWMQDYTGIAYPFQKFEFVLIPSFQYGGMEHVGCIFYNANSLFLDKSATQNQKLNRASLIAHETAHMWFGDLVTMKWFDDVWLKEVFANFMAAKIVHPSFPRINHRLGFLLKHHPAAYGEDRSGGSYPIQQHLENLRNAGTLYGRIIYQKAPVVMRQLETMIGPEKLQEGLREYLEKYQFNNAAWDDLITILDRKTELNLREWSDAWVKEPGTPELDSRPQGESLAIRQTRSTPENRYWTQAVDITVSAGGRIRIHRTTISGKETQVTIPELKQDYDFVLANGSELGYGYFRLDPRSKNYLLSNVDEIPDAVVRGAARIALFESVIRGETDAVDYLNTLMNGLRHEIEPLNRQNVLDQLHTVFWKLLPESERTTAANKVETILWKWIESDISNDSRGTYYRSLVQLAVTDPTIEKLYRVWEKDQDLFGLPLSENDDMVLALELAIRSPNRANAILKQQLERIRDDDRKKRFKAVMPAASPDPGVRQAWFDRLKHARNRRPERWVLEGLHYLHHPLRAQSSERFILPSLELLEEIQATGDIFFPKRWLTETFSGHRSPAASDAVRSFLKGHPELPFRLRNKILQAADLLLRINQ